MTKEEMAEMLNGREYREELSSSEAKLAAAFRLLVIYGASDDLVELEGAINDELGAFDGTTFSVMGDGSLMPAIDPDDVDVLRKYNVLEAARQMQKEAIQIEAKWCATADYSWTYETTAPHASFDIREDGQKYCRGIVIDLKELAQ